METVHSDEEMRLREQFDPSLSSTSIELAGQWSGREDQRASPEHFQNVRVHPSRNDVSTTYDVAS